MDGSPAPAGRPLLMFPGVAILANALPAYLPKCHSNPATRPDVRYGQVNPPIFRAKDAALQFVKLIVSSRMWKNINFERCLSHLLRLPDFGRSGPPGGKPAITLSRMCGAGGRPAASLRVEHLQPLAPCGGHWTVFGQDINNPELYHVVLNTDRISCHDAARLIADAVINRSELTSSAP